MNAWGAGLFESNRDLDITSDISGEAEMQLFYPEVEETDGQGPKATVKALDGGVFDRLFDKYKKSPPHYRLWGSKYYLVILMALGMQLGVMISEEQKSYARSIVKSAGLYKEGIMQFEAALDQYVVGQPYEFVSSGVCETLPPLANGILLLNHVAPRYHADNVPTEDLALTMINMMENLSKCDGCGITEMFLRPGQKFKRCTRCKTAMYCDRECQKRGWKTHKKVCGHQAEQAAATTAEEILLELLNLQLRLTES